MDRLLILIILTFIFYYDVSKLYIPNILNFVLLVLAIIYKGTEFYIVELSIIGMGLYSLPLAFLYGYLSDIFNREVFGFGDIKLLFSLGYILGYSDFYNIYIFYLIVFTLASLCGLPCLIIKRREKTVLPFSPFIILSFLYMWFIK